MEQKKKKPKQTESEKLIEKAYKNGRVDNLKWLSALRKRQGGHYEGMLDE